MADSDPRPNPPAASARRGPFSRSGLVELLLLVAVAAASALYAVRHITAHEEVRVDSPEGPLAHLDAPAISAAEAPTPEMKPGDATVRILPDAKP